MKLLSMWFAVVLAAQGQGDDTTVRHVVVFGRTNLFAGWPANQGVWIWGGREILVGFATGKYRQQSGHNIEPPYRSVFARSLDGGETWQHKDPDGFVGDQNGNPPALLRLKDGRLCCFYGNRVRRQLLARRSADHGRTWDRETVLRDDYASPENDADLGYPRAVQRADGQVPVFYYWASKEHPQQHIAATIWTP
jgi:hypothetical protein